jgi:outer membrane protein OmpA-like peptidoglycan-associated protein
MKTSCSILTVALAASSFALTIPLPAFAAEPPDALPAGVQRKVLDLVFDVEDLSGGMQIVENDAEIRIELSADVLFDFDRAELLPKAKETLANVAAEIRKNGHGQARVEGHTDSKGSNAVNQPLSEHRAVAVESWLVEKEAMRDVRFSTKGYGATKPIAPNTKTDGSDDPAGRALNRRVEIVLQK